MKWQVTMALTKKGELWTWGRFQASNFPRFFVDQWCNLAVFLWLLGEVSVGPVAQLVWDPERVASPSPLEVF